MNSKDQNEKNTTEEMEKKPARRHVSTPGFKANRICLIISAAFLSLVTLLNIFFPTRAEISEEEKRELAKFPEFSFSSLFSGEFFSGLQSYVGDHFWQREKLVNLSADLKKFDGFALRVNGEVFIIDGRAEDAVTTGDGALDSLIGQFTLPPAVTTPEDTTAETGLHSETGESSGTPVTGDVTTPTPVSGYLTLSLSKTSAEDIAGGNITVTPTYTVDGSPSDPISWEVSDPEVISCSEYQSGVSVEALKAGEATLTCRAGHLTATCRITVKPIEVSQGGEDAVEFLQTGGYLLYGKAAYVTASYTDYQAKVADNYRKTAEYYKALFPEARVSVLIAPVSTVVLTDKAVTSKLADQGEIYSKMSALYKDSPVNFVSCYNTFMLHRTEYLFLTTDHHWNALGAYYAYSDFVSSIGMTPTPVSGFDSYVMRENYVGSIYSYNKDSAAAQILKANPDTLEALVSRKKCTMKITGGDGKTNTYGMAIFNLSSTTYGGIASFIGGDNPFTVINVPENPQDLSILILKDSYADQFTPYLLEHYGYIYVVDPRYNSTKSLYSQLKDVGLDDILFLNNLQVANTDYWPKAYLRLVGVQ